MPLKRVVVGLARYSRLQLPQVNKFATIKKSREYHKIKSLQFLYNVQLTFAVKIVILKLSNLR